MPKKDARKEPPFFTWKTTTGQRVPLLFVLVSNLDTVLENRNGSVQIMFHGLDTSNFQWNPRFLWMYQGHLKNSMRLQLTPGLLMTCLHSPGIPGYSLKFLITLHYAQNIGVYVRLMPKAKTYATLSQIQSILRIFRWLQVTRRTCALQGTSRHIPRNSRILRSLEFHSPHYRESSPPFNFWWQDYPLLLFCVFTCFLGKDERPG